MKGPREDGMGDRVPSTASAVAVEVLDDIGWRVPAHLVPLWQRGQEVEAVVATVRRLEEAVLCAQKSRDALFGELDLAKTLSRLEIARLELEKAKPFAVCPKCWGRQEGPCDLCLGRGLISKARWHCHVAAEKRELWVRAAWGESRRKEGA